MSKLFQRLLVFFLGLPLVIGLISFKGVNHLPLHIVIFAVSLLASAELYNLLKQKITVISRNLFIILSVIPPFVATICAILNLDTVIIGFSFVLSVMIAMAHEVLFVKSFEDSIQKLCSTLFGIFYTGYLITYVSKMTMFEHSREFLAIFILMVCMCDSVAWFFGNLFGKNNKGFIKASPNKSIAGFLGGFAGSVLSGIIGWFFLPEVFGTSIIKVIVLGLIMAFVSIIGDLIESVIKRSADIKDSGTLMPGRGGILDSIDSIIFAAPVYYCGINFLFVCP